MASAFFGINVASRAMQAFQYAMLTTAHNMANVNTRGYSRQVTDLAQGMSQTGYGATRFLIGGGVDVAAVTRVRDVFLQRRYVETSMDESRYQTLADNLRLAETAFGELSSDSGISTRLDAFFGAFLELSANPADLGMRTTVRQAASDLALQFRTLDADLKSQEADIRTSIEAKIGELNGLAADLAALNKEIVAAEASGTTPNDLYDQRDAIVSEMAEIADIRTTTMPNGTMQVFLEQHTLVDQTGVNALPTTFDVASGSIVVGTLNIHVSSGSLAGDFEALQRSAAYRADLDALAAEIVSQVNLLHSSGYTLDGQTGIDLFSGTSAATFDLSDDVKASAGNIVAAATDVDGDGAVALAIADLQYTEHASLGGRSFGGFYGDLVLQLGSDVSGAAAAADAQSVVRDQITAQMEANSGVSLDEEMARMLEYQKAYQAAAKVLTILDSVIEETIEAFGG
jgi:flagellar hook-associated protein 1 FlgK